MIYEYENVKKWRGINKCVNYKRKYNDNEIEKRV